MGETMAIPGGTLIAFQDAISYGWSEAVWLHTHESLDSQGIVALHDLRLVTFEASCPQLRQLLIGWDGGRPLDDILEMPSQQVEGCFEDGPLGQPPNYEETQYLIDEAESLHAEASGLEKESQGSIRMGWLRGGGEPSPPRKRLLKKTPGTPGVGITFNSIKGTGRLTEVPVVTSQLWVVCSINEHLAVGTVVTPDDGAVYLGSSCLMHHKDEVMQLQQITPGEVGQFEAQFRSKLRKYLADVTPRNADEIAKVDIRDHRIVPLCRNPLGHRAKDVRQALLEFSQIEWDDWPLVGPRCLAWNLQFCVDQTGGGFTARCQQFQVLAKLQMGEAKVLEYMILAKALDYAWQIDQLDVTNSVGGELLARRTSLIEERHRFRLPQLDQGSGNQYNVESDTGLFLGLGAASMAGRGAVMVMPALSSWIGDELQKEAAILKGKMKSHELRQKMRGSKTGDKSEISALWPGRAQGQF